jgi:hypothetical protein
MRTQLTAILAAVLLSVSTHAAQLPKEFAGSWKSAPYELPLATDFDRSVWGPDARSVRNTQLRIQPTGEGILTVTRTVLDAKGKSVPGSTSIEEARIRVGARQESRIASREEYAVTVASAERRYPDDPGYKWPLEGLRVRLTVIEEEGRRNLEVRFDTPEGRGSFWETLRR